MRIVGGMWRGQRLEAPPGRGTRPTTDRAREAIASMILSARGLDLTGAAVLDAFAGSGAMGYELLSRGAASCLFVERNKDAMAVLRRNAPRGAAGARFALGDALAMARWGRPDGPFDVVFLDPPYALEAERVSAMMENLIRSGWLAEGATVVYEHAAGSPGLSARGLVLDKTRDVGGAGAVDLMTYVGGAPLGETPPTAHEGDDDA